MRERVWIPALALLLLVASVAYSVMVSKAKPKSLVSASVIPTLTISGTPDNIRVEGMWVFTLTVDSYDTIDLLMAPPSLSLNSSQIQSTRNLLGVPLPSGAELRARRAVKLQLIRNWDKPVCLGTILKKRYVFDDGTGKYREWDFWEIEHWKARFVSYRLRVSLIENGVETKVLKEQDVVVGPDPYGVREVSLPEYGIRILNLGQIPDGIGWPNSDLALVYVDPQDVRWVSKTDLKSCLRYERLGVTYPGSPCKVKIKLVDALVDKERKGTILDDGKRYHHHYEFGVWKLKTWITTDLEITEGFDSFSNSPRIYVKEEQGNFGSTDYEWKIKVETSPGFNPEEFRLKGASWQFEPLEWSRGAAEQTYTIYFHAADPDERSFELEFRGAADRWVEVSQQTGAAAISKAVNVPEFIAPPPGLKLEEKVWGRESLYRDEAPLASTDLPVVPGTTQIVEHMGVLCSLPSRTSASIRVEVPLSLFDSYVYIPPGGIPKITKVEPDPLELPGGGTKKLKIWVKNLSKFSGGVFAVEDLKLPADVYCLGATSPVIGPEQEGCIEVTLNAGRIDEDREERVSFTVRAVGSRETPNTDSGSFTLKLKKGYGITPSPEYSSLTVAVLDKKTGEPIQGAIVICAGYQMETDSRGMCVFDKVRTGSQTVTVSKEGYFSVSKSVTVLANQSNFVTIYLSTSRELSEVLRSYLPVIALVPAVAGASYYFYRKRVRR